MAAGNLNRVIRHLRSVLERQAAAGIKDGDLLKYYVQQRDEAAFETLVRRHGPMVMGVCRRVLHNLHDAEDAFQATFLVLVRKASTLLSPNTVSNWLYGVAYRTAQEAKRTARRRREKEASMVRRNQTQEDSWTDVRPVLDQELERLPDKYRAVVVLCDLEGKTRKEAARHLGWPEGSVAGRLARGRVLLATRLTKRGVALSGGALAAILSQNGSGCARASVVSATIKAASLFAAGQAATAEVISARVAALTEGVLKTMLLTKLKTAMAVLLVVAVVGVGSGGLLYRTQAAEPASPQREEQTTEDSPPSLASLAKQLQKLQKTVDGLREEVRVLRANLGRELDRPGLPAPRSPVPPDRPLVAPADPAPRLKTPAPENDLPKTPATGKRSPAPVQRGSAPNEELPKTPATDKELQETVDALREEVWQLRAVLERQRIAEDARRALTAPREKKDDKGENKEFLK
jgi:RNA polymerase sigma factor (sigma-70 family)